MATTKRAKGPSEQRQRPVFSRTFFPVQIAVFEHPTENGRQNYSVKLSRSFRRDEESEWETTDYLGAVDLLPAARLLSAAYDEIQARQARAYRERQETGDDAPY